MIQKMVRTASEERIQKYCALPQNERPILINYLHFKVGIETAVYFYFTLEYLHCIGAAQITKRKDPPNNNQPIEFRVLQPDNPEWKALEFIFMPSASDDVFSLSTQSSLDGDALKKILATMKKSADNRWRKLQYFIRTPYHYDYYPYPKCFTTPGVSEGYVFEFRDPLPTNVKIAPIGVKEYHDQILDIWRREQAQKRGLAISHATAVLEEAAAGKRPRISDP